MDRIKPVWEKCRELARKYRYFLLVLGIGLLLLLLPQSKETPAQQTQAQALPAYGDITLELTQLLTQVQGAGRVKVMLTVEAGESTVYEKDDDITDTGIRKDTVILTDGSRGQSALISRVDAPVYRGAVILCQGADSPSVKLSIMEAVARITGLGMDKISVLKMK